MEKNNSLYIDKLSEKMELKKAKVSMIIETFVLGFAADLNIKTRIGFEPFGTFEVNKHLEYIEEKEDGTKVLYPPRLEVVFSSSALAGVLLSSSEDELENTYKELKDRCNWEPAEVAIFIAHLKSTLKSQLLQEKRAFIPSIGAFEGELGGEIVFVADSYFANMVNKPFSYFEPEILSTEEDEEKSEVLPHDTIASVEVLDGEEESSPSLVEEKESAEPSAPVLDVNTPLENEGDAVKELSEEVSAQVVEKNSSVENKRDLEFYALEKLLNDKDKQIKYYRRLSLSLIILILFLAIGGFFYWSNTMVSSTLKETLSPNLEVEQPVVNSINPQDEDILIDKQKKEDVIVSLDSEVIEPAGDSLLTTNDDVLETIEPSESYIYHTLKRGETLRNIAYKYYKDYDLWPMLVSENKDVIRDPNKVPVGQTIKIPIKK